MTQSNPKPVEGARETVIYDAIVEVKRKYWPGSPGSDALAKAVEAALSAAPAPANLKELRGHWQSECERHQVKKYLLHGFDCICGVTYGGELEYHRIEQAIRHVLALAPAPARDGVRDEELETIDGENQSHAMVVRNLAMLVRRLAHRITSKYEAPDDPVAKQAWNYLMGEGLQGSVLRAAKEQADGQSSAGTTGGGE